MILLDYGEQMILTTWCLDSDKDRKTASPDIVARGDTTYDLVRETDIEAGRLYITDTHVIHDASATGDNVFQFFIALSTDSMPVLKELL